MYICLVIPSVCTVIYSIYNVHVHVYIYIYSTDQMQGIRQTRLSSHVNAFVSLYKPI